MLFVLVIEKIACCIYFLCVYMQRTITRQIVWIKLKIQRWGPNSHKEIIWDGSQSCHKWLPGWWHPRGLTVHQQRHRPGDKNIEKQSVYTVRRIYKQENETNKPLDNQTNKKFDSIWTTNILRADLKYKTNSKPRNAQTIPDGKIPKPSNFDVC